MIWFTSDTHFCHKNILHLTETPFHSVQERDEAIIKRWNEVVGENDTVYVQYNTEKMPQMNDDIFKSETMTVDKFMEILSIK